MFPLRDENPHFLTPYVTLGIISLNVLVWWLIQGFGMEPALSKSVCNLGLIPADLLGTAPPGAAFQIGPGMLCVLDRTSSWFNVLTSMFMHGGWMHIIGNMWFLWIFGNNVEDSMGHARFAVFYLLCGVAAALIQVVSAPGSGMPMVGASGAIGGVMGAYIMLYPRVNVQMLIFLGFFITTVTVPAYFMLGYWFLLQIFGGIGALGGVRGGTAFWAHIGGFVAGALLVLVFRDRALVERHPMHGWRQESKSWQRIK